MARARKLGAHAVCSGDASVTPLVTRFEFWPVTESLTTFSSQERIPTPYRPSVAMASAQPEGSSSVEQKSENQPPVVSRKVETTGNIWTDMSLAAKVSHSKYLLFLLYPYIPHLTPYDFARYLATVVSKVRGFP